MFVTSLTTLLFSFRILRSHSTDSLSDKFDIIISGESTALGKPDPEPYLEFLRKSKIGNKNLTCCEYENKKIRITPNNKLLHNLQKRYDIFNNIDFEI